MNETQKGLSGKKHAERALQETVDETRSLSFGVLIIVIAGCVDAGCACSSIGRVHRRRAETRSIRSLVAVAVASGGGGREGRALVSVDLFGAVLAMI